MKNYIMFSTFLPPLNLENTKVSKNYSCLNLLHPINIQNWWANLEIDNNQYHFFALINTHLPQFNYIVFFIPPKKVEIIVKNY
jgi:hypothetical protein